MGGSSVMQIHCPGCGVRLSVPMDAGGRPARCPACKTRFRVPDPRTMLDDTVTCWLGLDNMDPDEEAAGRKHVMDHDEVLEKLDTAKPATQPPSPRPQPVSDAVKAGEPAEAKAESPAVSQAAPDAGPSRRVVRHLVKRGNGDEESSKSTAAETSSSPEPTNSDAVMHTRSGSYFVSQPQPARNRHDDAADAAGEGAVRLQLVDVGTAGVKIVFNANLLDNFAFRCSMPMRGIVSGETDPTKLVARPLAWIDKATGHFTNPGELEARYEQWVRVHQTERDVVESMATISQLPSPFNQPMPFYVSREDLGKVTMHCETVSTPRGMQCEVTIPSVRYAMEWVGRVNGVCSADYLRLEQEVSKLEAGAWKSIPGQVRHRLAVWFDFQDKERFLGYFIDSDFARSDAGLGGLVLTDRRLVYCKYHHHGDISLNEPGELVAVEEGCFATLYWRREGARRKLVRLRREDLEQLAEMIGHLESPMEVIVEAEVPAPDLDDQITDEPDNGDLPDVHAQLS
jgi:hypothetical protein